MKHTNYYRTLSEEWDPGFPSTIVPVRMYLRDLQ